MQCSYCQKDFSKNYTLIKNTCLFKEVNNAILQTPPWLQIL